MVLSAFPGATKKKKNEACASFHCNLPHSSPHLMINDSPLSEEKHQFTPLHLKNSMSQYIGAKQICRFLFKLDGKW